jgi:hypothetical protein
LLLKCIKRELFCRQANGASLMYARNSILSSTKIISNLELTVESLISEMQQISANPINVHDADALEQLEIKIHAKMAVLADSISAIKLQEALNSNALNESEKNIIKTLPKKYKSMGRRAVKVRMLGGTLITVMVPYYHQKSDKKMGVRKGFYPKLLLLGIHDRCTSAICSRISLFATAACSLEESKRLMETLYGFKLDIKTIRMIFKRFALRARACFDSGQMPLEDEFKGKRVVISTDGGRIRTRKNKRGNKTKKGRTRYRTDWREPKLILIYVINADGEKDRKIPPIMDASLGGPDATFAMLLYYLKKLGVATADKLLFVSDGAKWIWERIAGLISNLGIKAAQCSLVLDFYHAVEHLTSIASRKKWKKQKAKKWVSKQRKRLLKGKRNIFMEEIERLCHGSKNKILLRELEYFKTHLSHMHYKELKDGNFPIGSGAVESGIRRVVNLRLKGPGIFWHEEIADAMLLLRSYYKAGRWNLLKNMAFIGGLNANECYL